MNRLPNTLIQFFEEVYLESQLNQVLDEEENKKRGFENTISTPDSKVKVLVIPTNEELAIARETVALV